MKNLIFQIAFSVIFCLTFIGFVQAEKIYNPINKKAIYEYNGIIGSEVSFKSEDFSCIAEICKPFNLRSAVDIQTSVPLDGFDYFAWSLGWNLPKKVYPAFTFMVKDGEDYVWKPYSEAEIKSILGI